ncbi:hypothetical protein ACHAXR_008818 [Thalassiosira sp. AJA248-18]
MSLFSRLSLVQRQGDAVIAADGGEQREEAANGISEDGSVSRISAKAGVLLRTLKPGDITNFPNKGDQCTIHYEAFTEDEICNSKHHGKNPESFDSSRNREQTFQFRLGFGQVIEGMDVAVSKMSIGQEVEATIPYPFAYGIAGYPPVVPPRATLIFRIELIRFSSVV